MGDVRVEAEVIARYTNIDRGKVTPQDLERVVERKLNEALEHEGAEVRVTVHATDQ